MGPRGRGAANRRREADWCRCRSRAPDLAASRRDWRGIRLRRSSYACSVRACKRARPLARRVEPSGPASCGRPATSPGGAHRRAEGEDVAEFGIICPVRAHPDPVGCAARRIRIDERVVASYVDRLGVEVADPRDGVRSRAQQVAMRTRASEDAVEDVRSPGSIAPCEPLSLADSLCPEHDALVDRGQDVPAGYYWHYRRSGRRDTGRGSRSAGRKHDREDERHHDPPRPYRMVGRRGQTRAQPAEKRRDEERDRRKEKQVRGPCRHQEAPERIRLDVCAFVEPLDQNECAEPSRQEAGDCATPDAEHGEKSGKRSPLRKPGTPEELSELIHLVAPVIDVEVDVLVDGKVECNRRGACGEASLPDREERERTERTLLPEREYEQACRDGRSER